MKILALEFSSPERSVALLEGAAVPGSNPGREAIEKSSEPHQPFELIEKVLTEARVEREQVERVVVGLGPGSYTGIRGAIAIAQGWQLGRNVSVQGISSAHAVAAQAHALGILGGVGVVIDAQRGEFYLNTFEVSEKSWREIEPIRLVSMETVVQRESMGTLLIGPEVGRCFPKGRVVFPRAAFLAKLATTRTEIVAGEALEPIYLRAITFVKAPPPRILPEEPPTGSGE